MCVDMEMQLPREECRTEQKEKCQWEPRRETVQRCDATVKEVCHTRQETVCRDKCKNTRLEWSLLTELTCRL